MWPIILKKLEPWFSLTFKATAVQSYGRCKHAGEISHLWTCGPQHTHKKEWFLSNLHELFFNLENTNLHRQKSFYYNLCRISIELHFKLLTNQIIWKIFCTILLVEPPRDCTSSVTNQQYAWKKYYVQIDWLNSSTAYRT